MLKYNFHVSRHLYNKACSIMTDLKSQSSVGSYPSDIPELSTMRMCQRPKNAVLPPAWLAPALYIGHGNAHENDKNDE